MPKFHVESLPSACNHDEWSAGCEKIDRGGQVTPSHSGHVLVTACCVSRHVVMFDDVLTGEYNTVTVAKDYQGDYDGRGQPTASPMLTAIMSGGVGISGRELYKYR